MFERLQKIVACGEHRHFGVEKGQKAFLPINIQNKEGRYMLVVYALRSFFNYYKSVHFSYQMKDEEVYPEVMKICHFMRSLRINGFKADDPYNAVYFR